MRLIKRYSNRKLYDTQERHYVTLSDLAGYIRKGEDIKIVDYVTSADMTVQVFAQVIFEESKKDPKKFALDALRTLIQVGSLVSEAA